MLVFQIYKTANERPIQAFAELMDSKKSGAGMLSNFDIQVGDRQKVPVESGKNKTYAIPVHVKTMNLGDGYIIFSFSNIAKQKNGETTAALTFRYEFGDVKTSDSLVPNIIINSAVKTTNIDFCLSDDTDPKGYVTFGTMSFDKGNFIITLNKGFSTGIIDSQSVISKNALSVFPNPVTGGRFTVRTGLDLADPQFALVNSLGAKVGITPHINNGEIQISVDNPSIANGAYTLIMVDKGEIYSARVMVVK